ncbi:MAG: hypothetical protein KA020_12250 [Planctomycetes bacterium]|nr:hypothetical protein [Planctomycetota bacterium]
MSWLSDDPWLAAILAAIVIATLMAAAGLLAQRLLRRRAAMLRNQVALAAVVLMLLAPLLQLTSMSTGVGIALLPAAPATPVKATTAATAPANVPATTPAPQTLTTPTVAVKSVEVDAVAASVPSTTARSWPTFGVLVTLLWLSFAIVRLSLDLYHNRRLRQTASALPLAEPALQRTFAAAAAALGLRTVPSLRAARHVICPATLGVRQPLVLVPDDLLPRHGEATTAAMLRHECAHLAAGHHHQGVAVLLLRAAFGWHPLAHRLLAALAAAQEDVADNAAATGGDATAYARSLLTFAERAERTHGHPLLLSALGRSPLGDRVRRLLAKETEPMSPLPLRVRTLSHTTTALLLVAAATVRIAAQEQKPPTHPESGAAYLPLTQGSSWTWRLTRHNDADQGNGSQSVREEVAFDFGEVKSDAGPCHQLLMTSSDHASVNTAYWSADATGIYEFDHRYMQGIRGPGRTRTRLVPAPLGVETRWMWNYQLSYQTMGKVERDPEHDKVSCVGELLAMAEDVTVPAGVFKAAHIRITSSCAWWQQPQVRDLWFARNVGLVKETHTDQYGSQLRELLNHVVGNPPAKRDDDAAVSQHLREDPRARNQQPTVTWLPLEDADCYLHGRFAVVTFAAGTKDEVRTAFYVDADQLLEIARDDLPFWKGRWQAMQAPPAVRARLETQVEVRRDSRLGMEFTSLAQLYGGVEAHRLGCSKLEAIGTNWQGNMNEGKSTHAALWHCSDTMGNEQDLEATFVVVANELTAAAVKLGPSTRDSRGQRKTPTPGLPLQPPRRR